VIAATRFEVVELGNAIVYVVLDGVGDRPIPELRDRTPLEAAETPHLDRLAGKGAMGLLYAVKRGIAPESDAGVFSLLSYDPSKFDLSRGVVEAIGAGMNFREKDLALRCNFATVKDGQVVDRRAGRSVSNNEARHMVEAINNDSGLKRLADFELKSTIGHRCALVIHADGMQFSSSISNLDPAYARKGKIAIAKSGLKLPTPIPKCVGLSKSKVAIQTARFLNEFTDQIHKVLRKHAVNVSREQRGELPANFLLMRDAGTRMPKVRTLQEKFHVNSVALADMPVELGIAKVIGMDTQVFPPDRTQEGYSQRAKKALELAQRYDLVYVHLKGPDEPGHDGDFEGKKNSIQDIDSGFFSGLEDLESKLVCVTADHSTPCIAKGHTDDPVPLLIVGQRVKSDGSKRFTESYAKNGRLGIIKHGHEILPMLTKMT
jgi:2,3-bisphosphoglycerate-independent phosphoglycerate mutase